MLLIYYRYLQFIEITGLWKAAVSPSPRPEPGTELGDPATKSIVVETWPATMDSTQPVPAQPESLPQEQQVALPEYQDTNNERRDVEVAMPSVQSALYPDERSEQTNTEPSLLTLDSVLPRWTKRKKALGFASEEAPAADTREPEGPSPPQDAGSGIGSPALSAPSLSPPIWSPPLSSSPQEQATELAMPPAREGRYTFPPFYINPQ